MVPQGGAAPTAMLQQQQMQQQQMHHQQSLSPMQPGDLPVKRAVVVDRLRRRMESYRQRQNECQTTERIIESRLCEQNMQDTLALKQRFLETKARRQNKPKDKQQKMMVMHQQPDMLNNTPSTNSMQNSVHVQQKFLKRNHDDLLDSACRNGGDEPPVKLQCTTMPNASSTTIVTNNEKNTNATTTSNSGATNTGGLTKFSVEIVQQLEFTTSAANSQPQQISTNVTVKALTNTSVKTEPSDKTDVPTTATNSGGNNVNVRTTTSTTNDTSAVDIGTLVECKQEPDNEFADLDECAAALEKDALQNNVFSGLTTDENDEMMSDAFKDLLNEIGELPNDFNIKDFDFDDKSDVMKMEDNKDNLAAAIHNQQMQSNACANNPHGPNQFPNNLHPPTQIMMDMNKMMMMQQQQQQQQQQPNTKHPFNMYDAKHRHPFNNDFNPNQPIKTEQMSSPAAQTLKQMAEQHQNKFNQGFNPAGTARHIPAPNGNRFQGHSEFYQGNNFPANFSSGDLIKQEMVGSKSAPAGGALGGMYKQFANYNAREMSGAPNWTGGFNNNRMNVAGNGNVPGNGASITDGARPGKAKNVQNNNNNNNTLHINQAQQLHISQQSGNNIQVSAGQQVYLNGDLKSGNNQQSNISIAAQQGVFFNNNAQQCNQPTSNQSNKTSNTERAGDFAGNVNIAQNQQVSGADGGNYTVSQSQTINFTQGGAGQQGAQNFAKKFGGNGLASAQGGGGGGQQTTGGAVNSNAPMSRANAISHANQGMPQMTTPTLNNAMMNNMASSEMAQMKFMQQQSMRANQMHQMPNSGVGIRPPPPEYKTAAMMARFPPNGPPNIRRLSQQPIPPSGPMMRPHFMMNAGANAPGPNPNATNPMMAMRGNYMRGPGPTPGSLPANINGSPGAGGLNDHPEWRNVVMSQQQNMSFAGNGNRAAAFQHQGFSMNNMNANAGGNNGGGQTAPGSNSNAYSQSEIASFMQQQQMRMQQQQAMNSMNAGTPNMTANMNNSNHMSFSSQQMMHASTTKAPGNQMMNTMMSQQQMALMQQQQQQQQSMMQQQSMQMQMNMSNNVTNFNNSNDFNLDFLENLPVSDSSNFSAQDLLNSLDGDPGFNLQDIL